MYALYFILVLLTVYTDSYLQLFLGYFGGSVLPLVSLLLYPFIRNKIVDPFVSVFFKLINYSLFLSLLCIIIFYFFDLPFELYSQVIYIKMIKNYLIFLSNIAFIIIICSIAKNFSVEQLFRPFYVGMIALSIFAFFEYQQMPYSFQYLHFGVQSTYWRIRLLNAESSHTVPILLTFFMLSLYYSLIVKKNYFYFLVTIICFIFQLSVSSSKSLLVILAIALLYVNWSSIRKASGNFLLLVFLVSFASLFVFYYYFYDYLFDSFVGDLDNSNSTVTRISTNVSGYIASFLFPVGSGYFSYLIILPEFLKFFIENIPSNYSVVELWNIVNSKNDMGLVAQSFFSQSGFYWGIVGNYIFVTHLLKLKNESLSCIEQVWDKRILESLFVMILISLFTTMDLQYVYLVFISLLIIIKYRSGKVINIVYKR